jgi:hypothetical protein
MMDGHAIDDSGPVPGARSASLALEVLDLQTGPVIIELRRADRSWA